MSVSLTFGNAFFTNLQENAMLDVLLSTKSVLKVLHHMVWYSIKIMLISNQSVSLRVPQRE